nr:ISAs1 family transposase [Salmonella enterica]
MRAAEFRNLALEASEMSIRYYISSKNIDARAFVYAISKHWQIESMHWMLDMKMNEDASRIRRGNAAGIISGIKKMALNLLRDYKSFKAGLKRKRKKAAVSTCYIEEVLAACAALGFWCEKNSNLTET